MFHKSSVAIASAALLLSAVASVPLGGQGTPGVLVIDGGTLIDGNGAPPVANSVVVIENGRIRSAGARGIIEMPAGAHVIDARTKFLIPGLIDGHIHWRGWTGELYLNHGITSVFDLGNPTDWILAVREAERAGRLRAPHVFTTGEAISSGRSDITSAYNAGGRAHGSVSGGAEWARKTVRALVEKGVDAIKVTSDLSIDEYRALTDEAHKAQRSVLGHTTNVYTSVGGGMDGVVHLWGVSATLMTPENKKKWQEGKIANPYAYIEADKIDALTRFMVEHHTTVNPLLINEHAGVVAEAREFEMNDYRLLMNPELRYVPLDAVLTSLTFFHKTRSYSDALGTFPYLETLDAARVEEAKRGYKNAQEFTRRFSNAGGRVFAGTDGVGSASLPGPSLHQELQLLVDSGLTPMQALQAATKNIAEFFHQEDKIGVIRPGRFGDVVILNADPLVDIRNTQKIDRVIKSGEVLDGRYHRTYHPEFWEVEGLGQTTSTPARPLLSEVATQAALVHGTGPADMVIRGADFHSTSLVYLNGRPLDTTFVTVRELRARVSADRIPTPGTYAIAVVTPWPGGGTSNQKALAVK